MSSSRQEHQNKISLQYVSMVFFSYSSKSTFCENLKAYHNKLRSNLELMYRQYSTTSYLIQTPGQTQNQKCLCEKVHNKNKNISMQIDKSMYEIHKIQYTTCLHIKFFFASFIYLMCFKSALSFLLSCWVPEKMI